MGRSNPLRAPLHSKAADGRHPATHASRTRTRTRYRTRTRTRTDAECFGFHDWMHHRIGSTHVFHHLFSEGPCYRAVEATAHLRAFLEPKGLYNYDARPILTAAWQTAKRCHYVEGTGGVQYFKSLADAK